jgi:hypothetical protein
MNEIMMKEAIKDKIMIKGAIKNEIMIKEQKKWSRNKKSDQRMK